MRCAPTPTTARRRCPVPPYAKLYTPIGHERTRSTGICGYRRFQSWSSRRYVTLSRSGNKSSAPRSARLHPGWAGGLPAIHSGRRIRYVTHNSEIRHSSQLGCKDAVPHAAVRKGTPSRGRVAGVPGQQQGGQGQNKLFTIYGLKCSALGGVIGITNDNTSRRPGVQ